jgi:hypothetical protein
MQLLTKVLLKLNKLINHDFFITISRLDIFIQQSLFNYLEKNKKFSMRYCINFTIGKVIFSHIVKVYSLEQYEELIRLYFRAAKKDDKSGIQGLKSHLRNVLKDSSKYTGYNDLLLASLLEKMGYFVLSLELEEKYINSILTKENFNLIELVMRFKVSMLNNIDETIKMMYSQQLFSRKNQSILEILLSNINNSKYIKYETLIIGPLFYDNTSLIKCNSVAATKVNKDNHLKLYNTFPEQSKYYFFTDEKQAYLLLNEIDFYPENKVNIVIDGSKRLSIKYVKKQKKRIVGLTNPYIFNYLLFNSNPEHFQRSLLGLLYINKSNLITTGFSFYLDQKHYSTNYYNNKNSHMFKIENSDKNKIYNKLFLIGHGNHGLLGNYRFIRQLLILNTIKPVKDDLQYYNLDLIEYAKSLENLYLDTQ